MERRSVAFLIGGLLIGLLLGGGVVGSNEGLRRQLFGTALAQPPASAMYLVEVTTVGQWLSQRLPDEGDAVREAATAISALPTSQEFREAFVAAEGATQMLLTQTHSALTGGVPSDVTDLAEAPVVVCLGLDDNPYGEPGLYIYLKLPAEQTTLLPDGWTPLDAPKDHDLYWQLLACSPQEGAV